MVMAELTDALILRLSENIGDGEELYQFAVGVLEQRFKKIDAAQYDARGLQEATRKLLQKWRSKQHNHQEAFAKLVDRLQKENMSLMADDLQHWAEEEKKLQEEEISSSQQRDEFTTDELTDALVLKLSRNISDGDQLVELGVNVLKLGFTAVDAPGGRGINDAARILLQDWREMQTNRNEAFRRLYERLKKSEYFRTLASELKRWTKEGLSKEEMLPPRFTLRQKISNDELQKELKQALIDRFEDFLKNDWLDDEDAKTMPLQNHYTEPDWTQTIKGGLQDEQEPLPGGLCDILGSHKKILATGKPGSGKSSAVAKLALDWAQGGPFPRNQISLHGFQFMFVIRLRDVDSNDSLEDIIIQQHKLSKRLIHKDQIKDILASPDILVAFDGYDEYKKRTNSDIDSIIGGDKGIFFFIVTSRPGDYLEKQDRQKLTEIQIEGLSEESIRKCVKQYLDTYDDPDKGERLLTEAEKVAIDDLLSIPIILLLVCVLFNKERALPKTKTEIVSAIIKMLIQRAETKGKFQPRPKAKVDHLLEELGELSWKASQKDTKQLYLLKNEVDAAHKDIVTMGLLHGSMEPEKASLQKQPKWLTFPHKLIQDFLAGLYAAKCSKEEVQAMFPSWKDIRRQLEVVKFMCGLRDDPSDVIEYICQQFVENEISDMRQGFQVFMDPLFEIDRETKTKSVNPLCNDHIYYVQKLPLKRQSKLYVFHWEKVESYCGEMGESCTAKFSSPACAVSIDATHLPHNEVLAAISNLNQTITDMFIKWLVVEELSGPVLKMDPQATSFKVDERCELPPSVQKNIGQQLSLCHKLQILQLNNMSHAAAEVISNLGCKKDLRSLGLWDCWLSEEQCLVLCQQLQFTHHLTHINLNRNHIGSAGARVLAKAIKSWGPSPPLEELFLFWCDIDAAGCVKLMKALSSCNKLNCLYLAENPIQGAFRALDPELAFPQLRDLYLGGTSLHEEDLQNISAMITNKGMPQLTLLQLGYNKLEEAMDEIMETDLSGAEITVSVLLGIFQSESDEMLRVWKIILENVTEVQVGDFEFMFYDDQVRVDFEAAATARREDVQINVPREDAETRGEPSESQDENRRNSGDDDLEVEPKEASWEDEESVEKAPKKVGDAGVVGVQGLEIETSDDGADNDNDDGELEKRADEQSENIVDARVQVEEIRGCIDMQGAGDEDPGKSVRCARTKTRKRRTKLCVIL